MITDYRVDVDSFDAPILGGQSRRIVGRTQVEVTMVFNGDPAIVEAVSRAVENGGADEAGSLRHIADAIDRANGVPYEERQLRGPEPEELQPVASAPASNGRRDLDL